MKNFKIRYGSWALVAGAAEGIGLAFSKALAKRGVNIIMVDVQGQKLLDGAQLLKEEYHVDVQILELDLARRTTVGEVMKAVDGCDCRLLIYNAAFGPVRPFLENDANDLDLYLDLNCRTLLHLTHRFADHLIADQSGGILLMSSLAGLWGTALVAPYGASKAFDHNLAEALHYELGRLGIDVMACCAGATDTPNYRATKPRYGLIRPSVADPDEVAEGALRMLGKRALYIPGFYNRLMYFLFTRVFGRGIASRILSNTMRSMYS